MYWRRSRRHYLANNPRTVVALTEATVVELVPCSDCDVHGAVDTVEEGHCGHGHGENGSEPVARVVPVPKLLGVGGVGSQAIRIQTARVVVAGEDE